MSIETIRGILRKKPAFFELLFLLSFVYSVVIYQLILSDWSSAESGHGPIVMVLSYWLLYRRWNEDNVSKAIKGSHAALVGILYGIAALLYVVGEVGQISQLAYGSIIPFTLASLLLLQSQRANWALFFPVFFLLFSIPLPGFIVDPITLPMKLLVAHATELLLSVLRYPVARSGVLLFVGPYELQVADACAGLRTLFTLEALGLLYLNLFESSSAFRNVGLALLVVPISLLSNIVRVTSLCIITYHWGDSAGQGYLHEFAGIVLFLSALLLLIGADSGLRVLDRQRDSKSPNDR